MAASKNNTKATQPKNVEPKKDLNVMISDLEREIVEESIKITKNETSSCYTLVIKTKRLLELRLMK